MTRWLFCLTFVGCLTASARADTPLQIARAGQRLRVDGALREWRGARFVSLGGGALRYALATRDGGLYLAAEVEDRTVVRKRGVGPGQDALVLTLAMPNRAGRWIGTDVWLHPGVAGESKALAGVASPVARRVKQARRIQVVEGPREGESGYAIEAFIPWGAIRESDLWQMGRGALRYEDARRKGRARVREQTASVRPGRLGALPALAMGQGQVDLVRAFFEHKHMPSVEPRFDLKGDVQGDRRAERVALAERFVVVCGPGVHGGESYGYMELPIGLGGRVQRARLVDLTGDGKAELVVRLQQQNRLGRRLLWMVVDLSGGDPSRVFAVELEKQVEQGSLSASLSLAPPRRGSPRAIVVERGQARGLTEATYRESPARDVEPILLPWGRVKKRVYRFEGGRFARVDEERDPVSETAAQAVVASAAPSVEAPPASPSMQALVRAAKAEAGIDVSARADHHLRANVAGGREPEHIYVFGAQLVVVGPGIGHGRRFFRYGMPVPSPRDLRSIRAVDVTGDGRAEILLHVHQTLGGEGVERELLFVQRFTKQGFSRALSTEVARWQGTRRIDNRVRTDGGVLRISSGKARGWSASSYPFPDEPVGGAGRLLLPWKRESVRYRWVDGMLKPRASRASALR